MEIKFNEATSKRPMGGRVLDAPFVFIDLPNYIRQLQQTEDWQNKDRNSITVFKSDELTTVLICLKEAAVIGSNSIDGLMSVQVLEGKIQMQVETESVELFKGQAINLHAFIQHSIEAMEESILLITNVPQPRNETSG
jgi:quercetin dioxygenase-like cupin family protein